MLPPHIEGLTESIQINERFKFTVKTHEGEGYASLGSDLIGLNAVLECVGIAEVAYAYWTLQSGDYSISPYSQDSLAEFGGMISASNRPETLIDAFRNQDHWLGVYRRQIARRRGGYWAVGDGEILRVELVYVYKENPTIKEILIAGAISAQLILVGTFGWIQVQKQEGVEKCQEQYLKYGEKGHEQLMKQARLEGHFTEQHKKSWEALQDTVKTGIAACGSKMDQIDAGIEVDEKGVALHVRVPKADEPKR
jgi:hypothetical protein